MEPIVRFRWLREEGLSYFDIKLCTITHFLFTIAPSDDEVSGDGLCNVSKHVEPRVKRLPLAERIIVEFVVIVVIAHD